jgi:amino acid transporter
MSTLGWLASVSSSVFVLTTLIEAIINVTNADFSFPAWQYTLIMLAFLVITIFFNTWGARTLPMMETISLFGHIGGFAITIIPLWIMAPKNTASAVFTEVVNNGGWNNVGTACLVAQTTVMYCNLGSDSAVHIFESLSFWILVLH